MVGSDSLSKLRVALMARLDELVSNVHEEEKDNTAYMEKQQGEPLIFGKTINLLHGSSGYYLCIHPQMAAQSERHCQRLVLAEHLSPSCLFTCIPGHKTSKFGFSPPCHTSSAQHSTVPPLPCTLPCSCHASPP